MDRLRAINVFVAVAGAESLSAAARSLGQPLTTVSRQLAALESFVGTTLVARTTRRMTLTEAGRRYLDICKRVMEELDGAEDQIAGRRDELSGGIVVTAPVVFGRMHLLPVIVEFLNRHPKVNVRLQLVDRVVDLLEEGVDVALRIGALPDSSLIATRVGSLRLLTCASPAYLRSHPEPHMPADLAHHGCIAFSALPGGVRWTFKSASRGRYSVRIEPRLTVNTADAAVDAAIAGLGITRVLSYQAEIALQKRQLRTVLDAFDDPVVPVHLVHRTSRHPQPRLAQFLSYAAPVLRKQLSKRADRK